MIKRNRQKFWRIFRRAGVRFDVAQKLAHVFGANFELWRKEEEDFDIGLFWFVQEDLEKRGVFFRVENSVQEFRWIEEDEETVLEETGDFILGDQKFPMFNNIIVFAPKNKKG